MGFIVAHSFGGCSPPSVAPLLWVCGKTGDLGRSAQQRKTTARKPEREKMGWAPYLL
jgi:hypothetical protein